MHSLTTLIILFVYLCKHCYIYNKIKHYNDDQVNLINHTTYEWCQSPQYSSPSLTTPITKLLLFRTTTQLYTTKSSRCDITQASRDFTKTNQFLDQSATLSITRIIITFQWPSYSALYALQQSSTQNLSCHCQCVLYYAPKTSHPSKNLKLLY